MLVLDMHFFWMATHNIPMESIIFIWNIQPAEWLLDVCKQTPILVDSIRLTHNMEVFNQLGRDILAIMPASFEDFFIINDLGNSLLFNLYKEFFLFQFNSEYYGQFFCLFYSFLIKINLFILVFSIFFFIIVYCFTKICNIQKFKNYSVTGFLRFFLITTLTCSFFLHIFTLWLYFVFHYYHKIYSFYDLYFIAPIISQKISLDICDTVYYNLFFSWLFNINLVGICSDITYMLFSYSFDKHCISNYILTNIEKFIDSKIPDVIDFFEQFNKKIFENLPEQVTMPEPITYSGVIKDFLYFIIPNFIKNWIYIIFSFNFSKDYLIFQITFDHFGLILLTLAYIVGFLSLYALDTRLYWKNYKFILSFNIFIVIVFLYVSVHNILIFFLLYECLLIPSFLIVYFLSSSRRSIPAALYFVIWTQVGSFLVLGVISYIIVYTSMYNFFFIKTYKFTITECWFLYFLLFLGFGIKVPIWPFHYWITKTHVEAPAGFSMFLSGFLVKSAIFGFYKVSNILGTEIFTCFFSTICILGVVDASLKMWGQTDLKKIVAYGTIQEMNLAYLAFCWGDSWGVIGGILFCFMHAILSTLMFFLVDCIQKRFHTRSVVELSGLLHITPNLGIYILLMCIFYSGVPGTLKFIGEFYIFNGLFESSPTVCVLLLFIANSMGLIGFSKAWFNVTFGSMKKNLKVIPLDLNSKELLIINSCFFFLMFMVGFSNFFII